jgi:hypothetical protein
MKAAERKLVQRHSFRHCHLYTIGRENPAKEARIYRILHYVKQSVSSTLGSAAMME